MLLIADAHSAVKYCNQLLQGTKVSYGGTAAFNAGVGEKARADARIILEGIKTPPRKRAPAKPTTWCGKNKSTKAVRQRL